MSMQQVNLYVPELRPKKEWLTANTIFISAVGVALLMLFSSYMLNRQLVSFEQNVQLVEAQKKEVEARIERFKNIPKLANEFQLERQLSDLTRAIENHENIGRIIQGQNLGNESGFSQTLLALSRQSLSTVALEQVRISRGGKFVELKGLASNGQAVPKYLQGLKSEVSMNDTQFGLLTVNKITDGGAATHRFAFGFETLYPADAGGKSR